MMRPPSTSSRSRPKPSSSPTKLVEKTEAASAAVPRYRGSVPSNSSQQSSTQKSNQPTIDKKPSSSTSQSSQSQRVIKSSKNSAINSASPGKTSLLSQKDKANADIQEALSQVTKKVQFVERNERKLEAVVFIQRFWRAKQKNRMLALANEALIMSDLLQKKRKQKLLKDFEGRESTDELAFWKPQNDFNVFSQWPGQKLDYEKLIVAEQHSQPVKQQKSKLSVLNEFIKKGSDSRTSDNTNINKLAELNELIKKKVVPPDIEEDSDQKVNKLAGLNEILKRQDFKIPAGLDDDDDFDTFLEKLNARRNAQNLINTDYQKQDDYKNEEKVEQYQDYPQLKHQSPPRLHNQDHNLSSVRESEHEESKLEDYRRRLDEEFSIKSTSSIKPTVQKQSQKQSPQSTVDKEFQSALQQTFQPRQKVVNSDFYDDIDVSLMSNRLETYNVERMDATEQPGSTRTHQDSEDEIPVKAQKFTPLNFQRDIKMMMPESEKKQEIDLADSSMTSVAASKYDDLMNFLEAEDQGMPSTRSKQSISAVSNHLSNRTGNNQSFSEQQSAVDITGISIVNPSARHNHDGYARQNTSSIYNQSNLDSTSREAYNKARERLVELEINKEEQEKSLQLIQQLRQKERIELTKKISLTKEEGQKQADQIRQEMESRLEKQVNMIENLLADKKQLTEKVESLLADKQDEKQYLDKAKKVIEDRYNVELKKNKDAWMASEKVRRQKWEQERIHEIRAQTVKGLEPEIQRIVERNKDELRKAHDLHVEDMRRRKQEWLEESERKFQELRERLLNDKDQAVERERERGQQKLSDQYERLEQQFENERKRQKETVYLDSGRVEQMLKAENDRLKEDMKLVQHRALKEVQSAQQDVEKQIENATRKHQVEIKQLKDKALIERDEIKALLLKQAQDQNLEIQRKMKEEMINERNREIEAIIEKLGDETHSTQKQLVVQYERKVDQMKEKHEAELKEYIVQVVALKDKLRQEQDEKLMLDENLRTIMRRVNDIEIELNDKKAKIKELTRTNQETGVQLDCIYEDQERKRQELETMMRHRIEQKDSEIRQCKLDLQQAQHNAKVQIENLIEKHKQEIEVIQEKVQTAMGKKKDVVEQLQEELRIKEIHIIKLKDVINKQREELIK